MCTNQEEKWGARPKYKKALDANGKEIWEYNQRFGKNMPRTEKVMVPVDEFQLRSMAQTRASVKALSNGFRWVVVLAGPNVSGTPAEEMTGYEPYREPDVDILQPQAARTFRQLPQPQPTQEQVVDYDADYPQPEEFAQENQSYLSKGLNQANSRPSKAMDASLPPAERFPLSQLTCQQCGNPITQKVNDFSKSRYGKALCIENCQKLNAPLRK